LIKICDLKRVFFNS